MARVAFYAPMKSPDSPNPSGDREMARNLMKAISARGDTVELASELRIYDKSGDRQVQEALQKAARAEIHRLIQELPVATNLWVTYHNYYKAPDLLGPEVCRARGIPYVQLESTRATSRLNGSWDRFARCAHVASDAALVIFYHTANDLITLERERYGTQQLVELPPFLPITGLPVISTRDGPMLTVGMMRPGDKLISYKIMGEALAHLTGDWVLDIVGDGPARAEVGALMTRFGNRIRFLGQLDQAALQKVYRNASFMIWPGYNEAYGMVYLEAQASGIPVVAQNRPGVRDVLLPSDHPTVEAGVVGLAARIQEFLNNPGLRRFEGDRARDYIAARHLLPTATDTFWSAVRPLLMDYP